MADDVIGSGSIRITGDASDFNSAVDQSVTKLDSFEKRAVAAGKKASVGMSGMGDGAPAASKKVEAATKNMIGSIQRTTAAMEAGSRSTAQYYETLAKQRGINVDDLKPYLSQLDAVSAKQGLATKALAAAGPVMQQNGMSAKAMANNLRGLPAQFTDIAVSLQGGQRPLTVLLQQGGQLKDMFGGIGPAAKAMGGYVMGLVNPFTVAAGAAALLGTAYLKGQQESVEFNKSLTLTGGFAGKTSGQLGDMAERLGAVSGTVGKAADALNQIAGTGKLTGDAIEGIGAAAIAMNSATGKAVSDTVAEFVKLAEEPSKASAKLNEQYHYLTTSVYEQIKALEDQGRKQDAATLAEKTYSAALTTRAGEVKVNAGLMERAWNAVGRAAAMAWDTMAGLGRTDGLATQLAEAQAKLLQLQDGAYQRGAANRVRQVNEQKAVIVGIQEQIKAEARMAQEKADAAQVQLTGNAAVASVSALLDSAASKQDKMNKALKEYRSSLDAIRAANPNSALLDADKVAAAEKAIRNQYKETEKATAGASASIAASLRARLAEEKALSVELATRGTQTASLNQYERQAAQIAEQMTGTMSARAKAQLEVTKTLAEQVGAQVRTNEEAKKFYSDREKYFQSAGENISKIEQEAQALEDQASVYGLGKSAIESLTMARLREQKAILSGFTGSEEEIERINREIEARERLGAAMAAKETLDKQKKTNDETLRDWKKTVDNYGDVFRQGFADMLNNGKDGWKSFTKSLVTTFKTTVADQVYKMFAQPFVVKLVASLTGLIGGGAAAASGLVGDSGGKSGMGVGDVVSNLSSLNSAYGALSQAITGATAGASTASLAYANFVGMVGGDSIGALIAANGGWAGASAGASGAAAGSAAGGAAGGMSLMGPLAIVAGVIANSAFYKQGWDANNGSLNTGVGAVFGGATGTIHKALEGLGMSGYMASMLSGSAITSRLFGMRNKEYGDTSIVGNFGAAGFTGRMQTPWSQKGGVFRSDKDGVQYRSVSDDMQSSLSSAFLLMKAGIMGVADSVGVASDSLGYYSEQIRITLTSDAEKNQELIATTLSDIGERMVTSLIPTIADYARESETASQTLQRLSASLATANIYLKQVQKNLLDVSLAGADAAAKLGDAFGGLDKLGEATQAFYMVAYTEGERATQSLEGMRVALQSVGVSMPRTMLELRDMALALDLTTDAGRSAYAALLTIAPEFAAIAEATKRLAEEMGATLLESFTARGQLVAALDVTALKTQLLRDTLVSTYVAAGNISTLFLDLSSGLITFGGSAAVLDGEMTGAQAASAMLADQIAEIQAGAAGATIDFAKLATQLGNIDTNVFVATISKAFEVLAQRISGLISDIASERVAVREAAREIIDPGAMTPDAIRRQIAGINTTLPGNSGVVAAGMTLSAADAVAEQKKRQEEAARNSYLPAQGAYQSAQSAIGPLSSALSEIQAVYDSYVTQIAQPRKYSEGRAYVRGLQAELPGIEARLNQARADLAAAQGASSNARLDEINAMAAAYARAVTESASAQAAANAAALEAKKSQTSYADALQAFAIDASKSVGKLSTLREETMRYYQAQKQLAELMGSSAAGLRKTVADYRYSQLDPEDQFNKLQADYAKAYSMALSTDGDTLVGYADQLNSMLNPMLEKARDVMGSDTEYNAFVATMLARAENIAGRLDVLAPADYEDESLALLGQIDATLAALEASSRTAEQLVVNAINAARDATVDALRHIASALGGQSIAAFASGGDHLGGLRLVGERGPELEVTGPSRIFNASQTRSMLTGGGNGNAEMVAELRELRAEVANLRIEARATASNTGKIVRQGDRIEIEGQRVFTDAETPLDIKETA